MDNTFGTINGIIHSPFWIVALYVFIFCIIVLWLSLVFWTFKDARKRIDDPIVIGVAVLIAFVLPFIGALVYAILRPAEFLDEVKERELEMMAMEQELLRACPTCGELIRSDFIACPGCRRNLRSTCSFCDRVLEPRWTICPFCGRESKNKRGAAQVDQQPTELVETSS